MSAQIWASLPSSCNRSHSKEKGARRIGHQDVYEVYEPGTEKKDTGRTGLGYTYRAMSRHIKPGHGPRRLAGDLSSRRDAQDLSFSLKVLNIFIERFKNVPNLTLPYLRLGCEVYDTRDNQSPLIHLPATSPQRLSELTTRPTTWLHPIRAASIGPRTYGIHIPARPRRRIRCSDGRTVFPLFHKLRRDEMSFVSGTCWEMV